MPLVPSSHTISGITQDNLAMEVKSAFETIKASPVVVDESQDITKPKMVKAHFTSMWGDGGYDIESKISTDAGGCKLEVNGYIAQIAVSPLTQSMDQFLAQLAKQLLEKYKVDFKYEKLTQFFPKFRMKFTKKDVYLYLSVLFWGMTLFLYQIGWSSRNIIAIFALAVTSLLVYEWFKNKKNEEPEFDNSK